MYKPFKPNLAAKSLMLMLTLAIFNLLATPSLAQDLKVTGKVTDTKSTTIPKHRIHCPTRAKASRLDQKRKTPCLASTNRSLFKRHLHHHRVESKNHKHGSIPTSQEASTRWRSRLNRVHQEAVIVD